MKRLAVALPDGRLCVATDSMVVVDAKDGRQSATAAEARRLLEQAKRDQLPATPFGVIASRNHDAPQPAFVPNTIWAQEPSN
jgi:hypothetical protein